MASAGLPPDKQSAILGQLQELVTLQRQILDEPPLKSQAVVEFLLQAFAVLIGVLFGAFAVLAWQAAVTSNDLSNNSLDVATSANSLAGAGNSLAASANYLASTANNAAATANALASCQLASSSDSACAALQSLLARSVSRLVAPASASFSISIIASGAATPTSTPTSGSPRGKASLSDGAIGGIVAGNVVLISLVILGYTSRVKYMARMTRSRQVKGVSDGIAAVR